MAGTTDILEPEVDEQEPQPAAPPIAPPQTPSAGPGQPPAKTTAPNYGLKDEDKQKIAQIITKMQQAGEPDTNIKSVVKRFIEINTAPPPSPVDKGIRQTTQNLSQPLQFNGTFQPDLEGEKNGLYLNDPDYQAQKKDFVSRIATDQNGMLLYPEQDAKGNWSNYYTKQPLKDFDPSSMQGKILQVPRPYLPATGGEKFITPKYDWNSNSYNFPGVQTPDVPHQQTLPQATVYGQKTPLSKDNDANQPKAVQAILSESDNQGGQFRNVLNEHPELSKDIVSTLQKYGPQYAQSLASGSQGMANVLQKTVEDKYNLNQPLPSNVDPDILNGHLNILNNFEKNRNEFEAQQNELQHQADLITDRSKRTGQSVNEQDADALAKKAANNLQRWNAYKQSVNYSQNYVNQPEVKNFLSEFQNRQKGISLLDELRQRSFPDDTNAAIKQDEYDRKAIEGNTNVLDYLKTAIGKAGQGVANIAESGAKLGLMMNGGYNPATQASIESLNNNAQQFLGANLPAISGEAIGQMDKLGIGHVVNDVASTVGGFAPYILPGLAEEAGATKALTFGTALAESLPTVRKEAEKAGLTGSAYNTYLAAKPLVSAAFMTLLPNIKFAKGFENDVAKSVVNGEANNPKQMLLNLASKAVKEPGDVAHLQAMLTGTNLGNAVVNQITNGLQGSQDIQRGISRKEGLPVEMSSLFDPKQTATMAIAGKVLEAVPTLKNAVGDYKAGKDIAETYNHIQSNLVELAAGNSSGVSAKIDELLKKDPGNIYAQHLKNTLQDFAHAEARMPEGLEPEQKAALFSVQKEISQKQRQMAYADPVYKPHIQKNIDELSKQIPDILKDPKKANDYLEDGHKELMDAITSPKTETDGKNKNAPEQAEGEIEKPTEGGETNSMKDESAPSFLESRHADTVDDEKGIVSGPNDKPISPDGKKDANDLAEEVKDKGVTKVITSDLERAKQTGNVVANKTGATIEHRPELNTWDIGDFDKSKDADFKKAQDFFVKNPDATEFEGKKINETFNQYKDRIIKARTALGNEPASTLVVNHSNNMMLWDAYEKNGHEWNEQAQNDYLSAKTPEPATLTDKSKQNALQIGRSTQVLQREQEQTGSPGSGRGRVEPSKQGEEPTGESGQSGQPPKEEGKNPSEKGEPERIGTKRSINDVVRQRMGLSEVPIPKLGSDAEEMGKAKDRVDSGKSNPLDVVQKIISTPDVNDIGLSTNDRYDMQYHMLQLRQKGMELARAMSETNDKLAKDPSDKKAQEDFINLTQQRAQHLDDEIRATQANRIGSAVWGKSGHAMDVEMDEHGQIIARIERIKTWYGDNVPADVQKKLDDVQKQLDESNAKLQKLQEDYNAKVIENEALKAAKSGATKARKTSEQFKGERKAIVSDMRDALRKARGDLSATIAPGVKELAAIAPHLMKLFKSYAEEGIQKVEDVLEKMKNDVEPVLPGITKEDIRNVLAGNFKETKKPLEKNQDFVKAQQAKANAMMMLRKIEQQAMDSRKNLYMKVLDFATQWERRAIFAFNNVVFLKLSSAALLGSTVHKPVEFGVGKLAAKAFPKVAEKAIIEGNENLKSLAKFYSEEFDPKKFAQQTWQIYKRGESGLTQELSQKGHVGYSYDKWYEYAKPVLDVYTNTHQVIKDPIKRAVMESSMENILQWYRSHGMDPSHPLIIEDARQYAYKRAEYEIFQNKNGISAKINSLVSQLEQSGITQASEPGLHNKIVGNLKYTGSTLYHMLVPIATVPINITARASVGALLPYNIIKAYHLENNIKDLQPEQADIVMRNLKKGSIGAAYWALGIFLVGNAGGLWNRYDPDKKKSGQRDVDLKTGRPHSDVLNLGGLNIPKGIQHTPQLQALQYGATFANVHNHYVQDLKDPEYQAWGAGLMATLAAMVDNVPPAEETKKLIEGIEDPTQLQKVGQDLKRGFGVTKLQDAGILPPDAPKPPQGHHQHQHR